MLFLQFEEVGSERGGLIKVKVRGDVSVGVILGLILVARWLMYGVGGW